jgi:cytochrome c oxidase subunit 3
MTTLEATPAVHHHEEEANRPSMNQLGLWLFFASETFLFAALATGRFYIAGLDQPEHLNQLLGLGITSILLSSSILAYLAEAAIARGDRAACKMYLLGTMALGLVFAAGVAFEWATAEFTASEPYGTAFFSMTGLHATHVLSGIGLLALSYRLLSKGHFSAESHWGIEASIKYWHFVDVVWVFFYPILYLMSW